MSVRAYPIRKIEYGGELFNLWHDEYFLELLERAGLTEQLNMDSCGIIGICRVTLEDLKQMIKDDEKGSVGDLEISKIERAKEIIKDIEVEMEQQKTDCIDFYCF
jgi:hypothetical protein